MAFTDNTVYVTQDGVESVRCWRSDGIGLTGYAAQAACPDTLDEVNPVWWCVPTAQDSL